MWKNTFLKPYNTNLMKLIEIKLCTDLRQSELTSNFENLRSQKKSWLRWDFYETVINNLYAN